MYDNLFNNSGQLNASNTKEALQLLTKVGTFLQEGLPISFQMANQSIMNSEERNALLEQGLRNPDAKIALAAAMANPIRKNLDYQGVARRALVVDPLPNGAIPTYNMDIDVSAGIIAYNGTVREHRVYGETITVDTFIIASNPTVKFQEVRRRRFNEIDRIIQKTRQEIMANEDANLFAAMDVAAEIENDVVDINPNGLLRRDLVELKMTVDQWDLLTSKFFMNIRNFGDILNWSSSGGTVGQDIDPVTQREILQTGLLGKIWGTEIVASKMVPRGTIFAVADPEFVGVMPIRQDIEVIPADEPQQLKLGWVVSEEIGIGLVNPRAIAKGVQTTH